ncbi:hypothetical protein NEF87_002329 [Candidatus Lokiarchaeum ossiferum]|uniref:Uncharacterized protein n=1 Tax=Candidatus Lokiarchaeum ossiferum TaxID=2951803 RepID=A0ABY6HRB1_9ARCH|nr:hypothetical protein NEF87_002329 [Candidatus Lokiarchaeum sp. B-35]
MKKYPVSLIDLILTPIIMKGYNPILKDLPPPGIYHIRDLCSFGGYSYSAIQTAMSRAKKKGEIMEYIDDIGVKRYKLCRMYQNIGEIARKSYEDSDDFTMIIFSFRTNDEIQRRKARKILNLFGFRYFTKNVYIRKKILEKPFMDTIKTEGLEQNVFLFHCEDPHSEFFKQKLLKQVHMKEAVQRTIDYKKNMEEFLSADLNGREYSRRYFYNGPNHNKICFDEEPPVPESYFPHQYPMKELKQSITSISENRINDIIEYYLEIENKYKKNN